MNFVETKVNFLFVAIGVCLNICKQQNVNYEKSTSKSPASKESV
jgi:large-conductance mechanosensitive channel